MIKSLLMIFMRLLDAGAAAELFRAFLFQTDHIERFAGVVTSAVAGDILYFGSCLHFTKFYNKAFKSFSIH
jgi:hypothetical protein